MTSSKLAAGTTPYGQKVPKRNTRTAAVSMFIVHHAAGASDSALLNVFAADGGRGTSANYAILREGRILSAVPEEYRAWTSGGKRDGATVDGSYYDHRAITVETVNASNGEPWPITSAAFESLAALIEDCSRRHGFPLQRATRQDPRGVTGHRDLLSEFRASYATRCPGGIDVDALIARAIQIRNQTSAPKPAPAPTIDQEDPMLIMFSNKRPHGALVYPNGQVDVIIDGDTRASLEKNGGLRAAKVLDDFLESRIARGIR